MGWFNHQDFIRVDPNRRQNRGDGPCVTRPMTAEEWEKYGPRNDAKRTKTAYILSDADIERVSKRRRAKGK